MALAASYLIDLNINLLASAVTQAAFGIPLIYDTENVLTGGSSGKVHSYASLADMAEDGYKPWHKAYKLASALLNQPKKVPLFKVGCVTHDTIASDLSALEVADPDWYVFNVTSRAAQDLKDCSAWAETTAVNDRIFIGETNDTVGTGAADVLSYLYNLGVTRTFVLAQPGPVQVQTLTISAAFATDASIGVKVNGADVGPVAWTTDSDTTLAALAAALAATSAIATATVVSAAAGAERSILITAANSLVDVVLSAFAGGGATPVTAAFATTIDSAVPLDSGFTGRYVPLGAGKVPAFGKTVKGCVPARVTPTWATNVAAQRGNFFTSIGGTNMVYNGTCSADVAANVPLFLDQIMGRDVLKARLLTALVAAITPQDGTTITFDDAGISAVVGAMLGAAQLSVNDGFLAQFDPGTCITAPVAAAIPEGDRSLRILNGIVMSLKARGSIQKLGNFTVNIAV